MRALISAAVAAVVLAVVPSAHAACQVPLPGDTSEPDEGGGELLAEGRYIGETTNNVAEYRGLLLGLELARSLGVTEVEVINDSELVARQIGGQYKVKNAGMKVLHAEAMEKLRGFDSWAVRTVRREHNARADELVNEALDEALS